MRKSTILIALGISVVLAGCSQTSAPTHQPTRMETATLTFHNDPIVSDGLAEQTAALNASAKRIVRASTTNGALTGAAVGCGLGLIAGGAAKCATKAAFGTVSGAVVGNLTGKKDVMRRVELASPNALVRNLRSANQQLDSINASLPAVLAAQDADLNNLAMAYASNQITRATHDRRVGEIRVERAALAEALSLTASQARQATANLKSAATKGHSGLDWHIAATSQLARESLSARSTITLL